MSRITMALENGFEGRVLASFDLDEFANKVRADAIDEFIKAFKDNMLKYKTTTWTSYVDEIAEQLKEQNKKKEQEAADYEKQ